MVVLRPAENADIDSCVAVQRASTVVGYGHIFDQQMYPFPQQAIREEWASRFANGTAVTIALLDGVAVGVVGVAANRLEALFVVPDRWGQGVASQLHDHALARMTADGHEQARLEVLADNLRARRFYEQRGWELSGRTRVTPWPPSPKLVGYSRVL
ncbi:MAG TPA: GNAT family N-acetyltransferase [Mycobacteriales bacterium]|nr:GNAT family N-acetyltransferase [Mycobacteriales bacterium]